MQYNFNKGKNVNDSYAHTGLYKHRLGDQVHRTIRQIFKHLPKIKTEEIFCTVMHIIDKNHMAIKI